MISVQRSVPIVWSFGWTFKLSSRPSPILRNIIDQENDTYLNDVWSAPMPSFHLSLPEEPSQPAVSFGTLYKDLAELKKGATEVPFSERKGFNCKYGAIADHLTRTGSTWRPPQSIQTTKYNISSRFAPFSPSDKEEALNIASPIPTIPLGPSRAALEVEAAFEVRAYASALPEALTPLTGTLEGEGNDENKAPPTAILLHQDQDQGENENDNEDKSERPVIPAPQWRGKREPFNVLYYDEATSPPSGSVKDTEDEVPHSPVVSECGSGASSGSLTGWARLHAIAPPAIRTDLVVKRGEDESF